jgi:site-specific recombinase XerD
MPQSLALFGTQLEVLPPDVRADAEAAMGYMRNSRAANTRAAYTSDWGQFTAYCQTHGFPALPAPPGVVVTWLAWMNRPTDNRDPVQPDRPALSPNTISRRLAAVNAWHRDHDLPPPGNAPEVEKVLEGIKRQRGTEPVGKTPLLTEDVRRMAALCDRSTPAGLRDRALILLGFGGAFRRSELSGLDAGAIHAPPGARGVIVHLARSKGDQHGEGRTVSVLEKEPELCPVAALREWMEVAGIGQPESFGKSAEHPRPIFRAIQRNGGIPHTIRHRRRKEDPLEERPNRLSPRSIGDIISQYAAAVGHDPATIGAHSLRAGYVTSALLAGASLYRIQDVTGHRSIETLLGYYRNSGAWDEHPSLYL